jgi:arylformamidase
VAELPESSVRDTSIYRGMDQAALDAAYNNSAAVVDSAHWISDWHDRSVIARAGIGARLDVRYGQSKCAELDFFPAGNPGAPLLVFIHGGYWQRNAKEMFSFVAEGPNAHGIDVAVVGYTLAPAASLSAIVLEIEQAISFLHGNADQFTFDPDCIIVCGWSAGGHLASMACEQPIVRGALPISGIFDLEPIALSYINDALRLERNDAEALSPLNRLRTGGPPQHLFVGGNELPELQRQSRDYVQAATRYGADVRLHTLPGHHHFSILDALAKADGVLIDELVDLISEVR